MYRHLIVLLFLLTLVHGANPSNDIYSAGFTAIVIGLTIAAIGYMIASVIGTPQALGWAKNEIYENIYSIVLISSIMIFALAAQVFFISMEHPPSMDNYIDLAIDEIDVVLTGTVPDDFELGSDRYPSLPTNRLGIISIFARNYAFETVSGETAYLTSINFKPALDFGSDSGQGSAKTSSFGIQAPLLPGLTKVADVIERINEMIFLVMLMLVAQKGVLIFVKSSGPTIFFVGAFFRALPITRRLGSTLIAVFITLQFVYPAFLIFAYSEDFYGEVVKDFSGTYINVDWINGLPSTTPNFIIFVGPKGIVSLTDQVKQKGVNFSFKGMFPKYNYTVVDDEGRELCKGEGEFDQQIDCPINLNEVKIGDVQDGDTLAESMMFYNITVSFYGLSTELARSLYGEDSDDLASLGLPSTSVISPGLVAKHVSENQYLYEYTLSVPLLFVEKCGGPECEQELYIKDEEFSRIAEQYMSDQIEEGFNDLYAPGIAGDILSFSGKIAMTKFSKKMAVAGVKKLTKKFAKSTIKTGLKKVAGAAAGWPAVLLQMVTIKSDISTGLFDEIACDAYSGAMARSYFGEPLYKQPEVSSSSADMYYKIGESLNSIGEFTADTIKEMIQSTFILYSESDYKSCAGSVGLFNKMAGGVLGSASSGVVNSAREFNVTVLFTRVIVVFMIVIYSIVITVTLFRAIAENIGGDSSLMGLGKLV